MERQRGAGARDINLAFDLELPEILRVSKTPLKPQKSGKSRKTPQPELSAPRLTRRTPKSTKNEPTLASKRTPATARRRTIKAPVVIADSAADEIVHQNQISQSVQCNGEGPSTKKRKALDEVPETHTVAPTKKRRKRKSIGQQSLIKRSRAPLRSQNRTELPNMISPAEESTEGMIKDPAVAMKPPVEIAEKTPAPIDSNQDVDMIGKAQAAAKPRKRKRMSVRQVQKPKEEPTYTEHAPLEDKPEAAEGQEPAKVESPVEITPIEAGTKSKTRKRKRKVIVQSPKKRKKPPPNESALISKEEANLPVATPNEVSAARPEMSAAAVKKKRGRKPKIVINEKPKPSEELSQSVSIVAKPGQAPAGSSQLKEEQSQPTEDPKVPKRRGKKRRSINLVRKPRKKTSIQSPPEIPVDTETMQLEAEPIEASTKTTVAPTAKRKGRPRKDAILVRELKDATIGSMPDKAQSAEAPKKRGRPKKATSTAEAANLNGVNLGPMEDARRENLSQKPSTSENAAANPSINPAPFMTGAYAPTAAEKLAPQQPPLMKKRGRPRKQILAPHIVDSAATNSISDRPEAQPKRPELSSSSTSTLKPPTDVVPLGKVRPVWALALKRNTTAAFEDPLSDTSASKPRLRPKPTNINPPESTTTTQKPPTQPRQNPTKTIPKQSNALATTSQTHPKPNKSPAAAAADSEAVASPLLNQNSAQAHPPDTGSSPPQRHEDQLTSHIRQSRAEELSLTQDLHDLHAQRAEEMAEQKERDLQVRLTALRAGAKKKRKLEVDDDDDDGGKAVKKQQQQRAVVGGGGLEGFVFNRVASRGARKRVVSGRDDEIDPELQELLSKVKGVEGGRRIYD